MKYDIVIGSTRVYDDEWFREITAGGVLFLVPLDREDEARYILARERA